jgi:catechol 2,3-dioxygenase-like lactoylglutathione lyase family enzyme
MKVNRVLETALYAQDLAAAEAFYTTVLGLEVYSRGVGRHVFFRCGASSMFLIFNPTETVRGDRPHGSQGAGHVAWAISESELDAWREWFQAKGVAIEKEMTRPNGGRSLYFRDPAGNSLELATPAVWGMKEVF